MDVLVVESPAKAKTIGKYLGPGYTVLASYGHVRDLPPKDGSVRPDEDFAMDWEVDPQSQKRLDAIAKAITKGGKLYLATDPDREGEAISWHVRDVLKRKKALEGVDVKRVTFNAITKQSVLDAVAHPRELDQDLIDAYMARRALDYLVGFTLSPVLWRKLPGSRSAGRVQSVALRLICEREAEIEVFKTREYWTVDALFGTTKKQTLKARLTHLDGRKLDKFDLDTQERAEQAKREIERRAFSVASIDRRQVRRNPPPPFITSTLQQEASRKLGVGAATAMRIAQRLYEGVDIGGETVGLITYMRTDGVQLAPEAIGQTRRLIETKYGQSYVPEKPRVYTSKAKNAQEAHEAIRPTDLFRTPQDVAAYLDKDQLGLYELIWKRTVASQMESAVLDQVTVDIASADKTVQLRATGSVVKFNGFLTLYDEGKDENGTDADEEGNAILPDVTQDEGLERRDVTPEQHFTEPPPRYSEASLVKRLEELGIGRPSTYASIIEVLQRRNYVKIDRKRFIPEDRGRIVTAFLQTYFPRYVEYNFTAHLEDELDEISDGKIDWRQVLREFWKAFAAAVGETKDLRVSEVLDKLDEELGPHFFPANDNGGKSPRDCPSCANGRLGLKLGKFGAFIGCSNYPDCRFTRKLGIVDPEADAASGANLDGPKVLGTDPVTGKVVTLRNGPYGLYVQLGEAEGKEKPKRQSLLEGHDAGRRHLGEGAGPALAAARAGAPSRGRRADPGRRRPLRPVRQARHQIQDHPGRRERARDRHEPRRGAAGRGQGDRSRPRCRQAHPHRRQPSRRRGAGRALRGPLRSLREACRHQRHRAARPQAGRADARPGGVAAGRARRQGAGQETQGRAGQEGGTRAGQRRRRHAAGHAEGCQEEGGAQAQGRQGGQGQG